MELESLGKKTCSGMALSSDKDCFAGLKVGLEIISGSRSTNRKNA